MDTEMADAATVRAWDTYLMMKLRIEDGTERRAALARYIGECHAAGNHDGEALAVEGLKFLKRLDGDSSPSDDDM